jgi:anti-sigma B factor antagonist
VTIQQQELAAADSGGAAIWLVGVSGRLDQNLTPQLESALHSLLNGGYFHLVVDLAEVTYINSGGLRCLVSAWRQARQRGGNLALCGLSQRISDVFAIVGFNKVFQIYPTAGEAQLALQSS